MFNAKPLSWIGFWTVPPYTNDLVPILPWFGVFLVGMGLAPLLTGRLAAGWPVPVELGLGGQGPCAGSGGIRSILYLVHQPLAASACWCRSKALCSRRPGIPRRALCRRMPGKLQYLSAPDPAYCTTYCACSLEQIEDGDLWEAVTAFSPTDAAALEIDSMIALCTAMGRSAAE